MSRDFVLLLLACLLFVVGAKLGLVLVAAGARLFSRGGGADRPEAPVRAPAEPHTAPDDALVDRLGAYKAAAPPRIHDIHTDAGDAAPARERPPAVAEPVPIVGVAARVDEVLQSAETAAGEIVADARAEAEAIRRQAREEADALRAAAEAEALSVRRGAKSERDRLEQEAIEHRRQLAEATRALEDELARSHAATRALAEQMERLHAGVDGGGPEEDARVESLTLRRPRRERQSHESGRAGSV